jgi:protein gp37
MGDTTKIEWCDHTFNAWYGCTKVGPPCDHCYAEGWAKRSGLVGWGPHADRRRSSPANWKGPLKWAKDARNSIMDRRPRVFCLSLGDWLDNQVPRQWREDLADLIRATPELDWLLLTKRIQNYQRLAPWPLAPNNVWLGITCGDQSEYDRDWPILNDIPTPSRVRFISYEPALGPLILNHAFIPGWIICGGESGPGARTMNPQWARDLRDRCKIDGIAYFFKQMTGKKPIPPDLMVREFPR